MMTTQPEIPAASQPARRLAVFFPGIGYTNDRPLLYFSRRLAAERGYDVRLLNYGGFPSGVRGDRAKMAECFRLALTQAEAALAGTRLTAYDEILFVGKSVGTIVAARLAAKSPAGDRVRLVLYTPLEDTFVYAFGPAIAFTGTADPWVGGGGDGRDVNAIPRICRERGIPCAVLPDANHSLETGDCLADIRALAHIMETTARFIDRRPLGIEPKAAETGTRAAEAHARTSEASP